MTFLDRKFILSYIEGFDSVGRVLLFVKLSIYHKNQAKLCADSCQNSFTK